MSCEISQEAIDDNFAGDGKDQVHVFRTNRMAIEEFARKKYLAGQIEPNGSVLINLYKSRTSKEAALAEKRFQKFVHKMPTDKVMSAKTTS